MKVISRKLVIMLRSIILDNERLSVTHAARLLKVGRPALSNLLNGNAELSIPMAVKIEDVFGYSAIGLLTVQLEDHLKSYRETVGSEILPAFKTTTAEILDELKEENSRINDGMGAGNLPMEIKYSSPQPELLPCPFCGGEAYIEQEGTEHTVGCSECDVAYIIQVSDHFTYEERFNDPSFAWRDAPEYSYGSGGVKRGKEVLLDLWNTRADRATAPDVDALKRKTYSAIETGDRTGVECMVMGRTIDYLARQGYLKEGNNEQNNP